MSSATLLARCSIAVLLTIMNISHVGTAAQKRSPSVLVRQVLDGDTIDVVGVGRVRLLGIDAPEIGRGLDTSAPFAREAQERLAGLVTSRWVRLEYEDLRDDMYGRRLAYLFLEDGQFVNELLVREGLARVTARQELKRLGQLKRAEAVAQTFRRGIWGGRPMIPTESLRPPGQKSRRPRRRRADEPGRSHGGNPQRCGRLNANPRQALANCSRLRVPFAPPALRHVRQRGFLPCQGSPRGRRTHKSDRQFV